MTESVAGPGPDDGELLDVVDPVSGRVLEQRSRGDVHRLGLWHQVFHCLVVRPASGTVVLQRRSASKAAFPDLLDLSATGHLEAGEAPIEGIRELREELGIDPDPDRLTALGHRLLADDQGEGLNRELVHLYFLADDRPIDRYRPALDEVSGLVELAAGDLLELLADRVATVPAMEWSPPEGSRSIAVGRNDLVDDVSGYWVVVAVMADRFLRGLSPVAV